MINLNDYESWPEVSPEFFWQDRQDITKRTAPVILDDMDKDIEHMMSEVHAPVVTRLRKNQLYARIDGRKNMIKQVELILKQLEVKNDNVQA